MAKVLTLILAIFLSSISYCRCCSCTFTHPQEAYCNSDFVILARVKKEQTLESSMSKVYKVRVRKEFKISLKGLVALKSGKIHTPLDDSMCGSNLEIGKLYVISGGIHSLRAHFNQCNMIMEWNNVTRRQRKGLKLLYNRTCNDCKIKNCYFHWCNNARESDACIWRNHCQTENGICMRQNNGSCMWNKNKQLRGCQAEELVHNHSRSHPISQRNTSITEQNGFNRLRQILDP
ncbi:hypothetical protein ABEB36_010553 [Hypothenemus hampei]|uniref:NTR domain-containing protein n=1 Tax=Hypothenemus hampei TaxID=57062 RepID=A0ABD1EK41_HYPHA